MDTLIHLGKIYQHYKGKYYLALCLTEPVSPVPEEAIHIGHVMHTETVKIVTLMAWGDKLWTFASDPDNESKLIQLGVGVVYTRGFGEFWYRPIEKWLQPTKDGQERFKVAPQ